MAALLPSADDIEANQVDEMWRIIWLMPAFVSLITIPFVLLAFRHEPVQFCLVGGLERQGLQHLAKIFKLNDSAVGLTGSADQKIGALFDGLRRSTSMESSSLTLAKVLFGRKYRRATWVCLLICFFF
mmetsp:Transcript_25446/g.29877  ORF Transcript_25446/g.29877 Transcript_25446/m.29877 type:complete len:128 (+) Transcript_25446:667-1050(+)